MADNYHHGNLRIQMIEAGIELINKEGLKGFSLRKAAAKCGVSNAAPYSHFKSIDELIDAMGEHVTELFMEKLHAAIKDCENEQEAVILLGNAYIDFFVENPQYFQFVFYHSGITVDLNKESPNDYPPFALFRTTAYRLFYREGISKEEYTKRLAALWSVVHGVSALLTNPRIQYSGNWSEIFLTIVSRKGKIDENDCT